MNFTLKKKDFMCKKDLFEQIFLKITIFFLVKIFGKMHKKHL